MDYNRSISKSFGYAFEGFLHTLRYNRNLRIHLGIGLAVVILSIFFRINKYEMSILGLVILLVISSEMINTAAEEVVNLITNERRKEAKIAKDVAAGMVLVACVGSVIIGLLIFVPYILKLFE